MRNYSAFSDTPPPGLAGLLLVTLLMAANAVPALADTVASAPTAAPVFEGVFWTKAHVHTVLVTVAIVVACVILHYEAFIGLTAFLSRIHTHRHRQRLLIMMFALIVLHVIEIWIFAGGLYWLMLDPANGRIDGATPVYFLDQVYFSAVCYTTLGLGDLVPHGAIRFMTGMESLVGFLLITWSASFTFFEMERHWRKLE